MLRRKKFCELWSTTIIRTVSRHDLLSFWTSSRAISPHEVDAARCKSPDSVLFRLLSRFLPLTFSLFVLWPDILFTWTIITSTGQLKNLELVHEVAEQVEAEQFKKYSLLIRELEVKALLHQIKGFDNYVKTGKPVKGGQYEKWMRDKVRARK